MIKKAVLSLTFSFLPLLADEWYRERLFTLNNKAYGALDIVTVLLILIAGLWFSGKFKSVILRPSSKIHLSGSSRTIIANFGRYLIILITLIVTLTTIGIDLTSLTVIAGALSVGIGFGLQNIISNFVSGIILMVEQSIRIGDVIEVTDKLRGKVREIRMRSTVVTTLDNIDVIIPNSDLIQNKVINLTFGDNIRRLQIPFGVAYGTPYKKVEETVINAIKNCGLEYYEDNEKKSKLWMSELGDSSINYTLNVWIKIEGNEKPTLVTSDFLIVIHDALYEAGITIPFPQMDLHITEPVRIITDDSTGHN